MAEAVVCGPDPSRHLTAIRRASRAGYDHVCLHQIGPDQGGFIRFYEREIFPKLGRLRPPGDTRAPGGEQRESRRSPGDARRGSDAAPGGAGRAAAAPTLIDSVTPPRAAVRASSGRGRPRPSSARVRREPT